MAKKNQNQKNDEPRDRLFYEKEVLKSGRTPVAGIDEAGRGPLAGPVVASCVIIRDSNFVERIDDSKKLTSRMRERAFLEIMQKCDVGIGLVSVEDIDKLNIYNATLLAMKRALEELREQPAHLLIDGNMNVLSPTPRTYLINGEALSLSIACASIIAKVFRDRIMVELDKKYPAYGFIRHKGYGTKEHIENIKKYGLSSIHRKTFGPFGDRRK